MELHQPVIRIKKPYKLVKPELREQIVKMRNVDKYTLNLVSLQSYQISNLTGVNISSVKAICRIFRKEGRIQKKTKMPIQRIQQQILVYSYDEGTCDYQGIIPAIVPNELIFCEKQFSSVQARSNFIINSIELNIEDIEVKPEISSKKTKFYKQIQTQLEGLEHLEQFKANN